MSETTATEATVTHLTGIIDLGEVVRLASDRDPGVIRLFMLHGVSGYRMLQVIGVGRKVPEVIQSRLGARELHGWLAGLTRDGWREVEAD